MENLHKSIIILACLLTCFTAHTSKGHEVINEQQVAESIFQNRLNFIPNQLKSAFKNTRDFLGQKLGQFYEKFDLAKQAGFDKFIKLYNKRYTASELPRRMKLFFERKKLADESQQLFKQGKVAFEMKLNKFADLDENEIKFSGGGLKRPSKEELDREINAVDIMDDLTEGKQELIDEDEIKESQASRQEDKLTRLLSKIPESKDWRETGCIPEPADQMNCGSCYAMSTLAMVDSMLCLRGFSERPHYLSAQHIVDCAKKNYFNNEYYNEGCKNGWPSSVLRYLQEEGVAIKENCYPYASMENTDCLSKRIMKKRNCTVDVHFSGKEIPYKVIKGERSILYHVAENGPVVVTIYATKNFKLYASGIFEDDECNDENYEHLGTHAILIVGYGQEKGVDYWIISNSYGKESWGEGGFGRIKRGENVCNIGSIGWVIAP